MLVLGLKKFQDEQFGPFLLVLGQKKRQDKQLLLLEAPADAYVWIESLLFYIMRAAAERRRDAYPEHKALGLLVSPSKIQVEIIAV